MLQARAQAHREGHHAPSFAAQAEHSQDTDTLALRRRLEAAIEAAIAPLDRLDAPGEDLEDEGLWEPWLAAPEGHPCQLLWCRGADDDRESELRLRQNTIGS